MQGSIVNRPWPFGGRSQSLGRRIPMISGHPARHFRNLLILRKLIELMGQSPSPAGDFATKLPILDNCLPTHAASKSTLGTLVHSHSFSSL